MTQAPRYPLLFNPKARSQRAQRASRFIMERATRFALYATSSPEEARDLAAKFAAEGEPVVVAAGGDGTLNAVLQGLAGSVTALGVIPAGTMNVFARELGIPYGNLDRAFDVIERGYIREIDLFAVNGSPFMQMAGLGFDASVIEETTWESKKMLGPLAYLLSAVKVLGEKPPLMQVTTSDGRCEEGVAVLAGNGTLYGGLRTLDSVLRARSVFGTDHCLMISQLFQNERALYIAEAHGIKAIAYNAKDVSGPGGRKTKWREFGARLKMWLDVHVLDTQPKHGGPRETLPM